ncbi:MAG: hypothetical protein CMI02_19180 [Oceanospirillaceae bacterium]|nr:hypothetical protein [Oceanospirillaceae bacterium]MBT14152.1 hypothetical protein [Oceanospirillaceae bacterium]|tara:strand:- start:46104 stop:46724 length:621 start_codon:yes stop_codon:yes gene_type:complete
MNERINESLSALVDGETDELEVRRLLNQLESDDDMRQTWHRYQMMGALMRDEPAVNVDLSRGIAQAIAGEPMDDVVRPETVAADDESVVVEKHSRLRWLASGAVAATVTLAVLVGVRVNQDTTGDLQMAQQAQTTSAPAAVIAQADDEQPVILAEASELSPEELEAAQRKLQEYVMQHTEQAAMSNAGGVMPYARVVNFESGEETR